MEDAVARMKVLGMADRVIGIALVVALIAMFLPWYGLSCSGGCPAGASASVDGFHNWGLAYFVLWLALTGFFVIRLVGSSAIQIPSTSVEDWQIFLAGGVLMLVTALLFYTGVPQGSILGLSYGVSFGWFIALVAAIAVGVGGYLKRPTVVATSGGGTQP